MSVVCIPKECDLKDIIITEPPTQKCEDSYSLGQMTTDVISFVAFDKSTVTESTLQFNECVKRSIENYTITKQTICYLEGTKPPTEIVSMNSVEKKLKEMGFKKDSDGTWQSKPEEEVIHIKTSDLEGQYNEATQQQ